MTGVLRRRPLWDDIERAYTARYEAFCRMASTVTGHPEAAYDAVQEAFARALVHSDQFRGEGAIEAWLWRIVYRVALENRSNGRWPVTLREIGELGSEDEWMPELPRPELDPELASALRALPERARLMVFLRYFADLKYEEIAAICGVQPGTVSAMLASAKTSLARRLGPSVVPPEEETAL